MDISAWNELAKSTEIVKIWREKQFMKLKTRNLWEKMNLN